MSLLTLPLLEALGLSPPTRRTPRHPGPRATGPAGAPRTRSRRDLLRGPLGRSRTAVGPGGGVIVVFLRGGMDGLSAVVPGGDQHYHDDRPTIAVPDSALIDLDGTFGLHPALAPLAGLYQEGRLAAVHACGNPAGSRSHFDAQDLMEQGAQQRRADGFGWVSRHLATAGSGGLFSAVALSNSLPGSLRGSGALAIPSIDSFGLGGRSGLTADWDVAFSLAYHGDTPIDGVGTDTIDAIDVVDAIASSPQSSPFDDAVALLGAGVGVEVVTIDTGGWDTHDEMGTHTAGQMQGLLSGLGGSLAGLQSSLDAAGLGGVTTVVMTEFGRRVAENGSRGLDHGFGGLMLVMGGGVAGGRVVADWPGLAPDDRERGDLRVTTDFRDVLWEVVRDRLGHPDPGAVFEGHTHQPVGVTA